LSGLWIFFKEQPEHSLNTRDTSQFKIWLCSTCFKYFTECLLKTKTFSSSIVYQKMHIYDFWLWFNIVSIRSVYQSYEKALSRRSILNQFELELQKKLHWSTQKVLFDQKHIFFFQILISQIKLSSIVYMFTEML
jgi:hypothetical protein